MFKRERRQTTRGFFSFIDEFKFFYGHHRLDRLSTICANRPEAPQCTCPKRRRPPASPQHLMVDKVSYNQTISFLSARLQCPEHLEGIYYQTSTQKAMVQRSDSKGQCVKDLVASSGDVTDCSQLNVPLLTFSGNSTLMKTER